MLPSLSKQLWVREARAQTADLIDAFEKRTATRVILMLFSGGISEERYPPKQQLSACLLLANTPEIAAM